MDKKLPSTSRSKPYSFPCNATRLHKLLHRAAGRAGSGDPRSPNFSREGYLVESFLTKLPVEGVSAGVRSQRAVDKMVAQDRTNAMTNQRILKSNTHFGCASSAQILATARQLIAEILGPFSYGVFQDCSFSSGATTSRKLSEGPAWFKYDGKAHVTQGALKYALALIRMTPAWRKLVADSTLRGHGLRIVPGNVVFTVPKTGEIDRAAAKEPDLNMYLQKGVGDHIRARLKLFGINLNDQTVNQEYAYRGSLDGKLATLDLSSASDSVTWSLVYALLPWEWFDVMSDLRSPRGTLPDGTVVEWEMFSSMGNGFTFELESLVFYAITRAVCYHTRTTGTISVYGDDIIVPTRAAYTLRRVLGYFGFKVNTSKSFWDGYFRESCGKHYHRGLDVTPFYCRTPIDNVQRAIWFANKLKAWADVGGVCDDRFAHAWRTARDLVPQKFWGGKDLESVESVVTYHAPRQKLRFVSAREDGKEYGYAGMLAWFDANRSSSSGLSDNLWAHVRNARVPGGVNPASYRRMQGTAGRYVVRRNVGQYGHSPDFNFEIRERDQSITA